MRIAVTGTHCSGKSTLVEDFLAAHADYVHEPEPYEWLVELHGEPVAPDADGFYRQLQVSVERLREYSRGACVIAERCPLDFLAYLRALGDDAGWADSTLDLVAAGMEHVDLVVFVPLDDSIAARESEDLALRDAMNDRLLEIIDGVETRVVEVRGTRHARLTAVELAMTAPG